MDKHGETAKNRSSKQFLGCMGHYVEVSAGIFFTTLFLILFNVFYERISFLTDDFDQIRGLYNASLIVGILLMVTRLFILSKAYKLVTEIITNIFFIVIAYYLWILYPFNTSVIGDPVLWDKIFKFLIVVPPVITAIATFANVVKLLTGSYRKKS